MSRHLRRIEVEYGSGEGKKLEEQVIAQIREVMPLLKMDVEKIKQRSYPYRDSLYLCVHFLEVVDRVMMRCEYEPEAKALNEQLPESGGESAVGGFRYALNESRNKRDGTRQQSAVPYHTRDVRLMDVYERSKLLEQGKTEYGALKGDNYRPSWDYKIFNEVMDIEDIIVFPSYNPLNDAYFSKIRPVPMFILGVLEIPYMVADLNRIPPVRFFEHDCFHILDFTSKANRYQQYRAMQDRIKNIGESHKDVKLEGVYTLWDKNCKAVREQFQALKNEKVTARTAERLLFTLLHEPTSFVKAPDESERSLQNPTIPEKTPMLKRLKDPRFQEIVVLRCANGFYGEPWFVPANTVDKQNVVDEIGATAEWLAQIIEKVCVDFS